MVLFHRFQDAVLHEIVGLARILDEAERKPAQLRHKGSDGLKNGVGIIRTCRIAAAESSEAARPITLLAVVSSSMAFKSAS
jgi:hypothetical protein